MDSQRDVFVFEIGNTTLSVEATRVEAVTPWRPATRLPHLPGHYVGVINHEQEALIVLDLERFLALDAAGDQPANIMVLRCGELRAGIPVDRALGIARVQADDMCPPTSLRAGRLAEFVEGQWEHDDAPCGFLAVDDVLEAARV